MKKILVLLLLAMSIVSSCFASEDTDVVNSFKQYASDNISKAMETYEGTHYNMTYISPNKYSSKPNGYWLKITGLIDPNYKIDVQKSNSLISPYIGILEITYKSVFYKDYATKELSEASIEIERTSTSVYKFTIAYQDGKWTTTDARSYNSLIGSWSKRDTNNIFEELRCKYEKH